MKIHLSLIILALVFSASVVAQEFAYVTDSLQLRVYANPSSDSEVLQTLDSGDSVEIFATQDGFSQVTTYDDTKGWVKTAFLVEDPPAKLLYYSVDEKNKELEAEIEALKNSQGNNVGATTLSESDTAEIKELRLALSHQQEANQALQELLEERKASSFVEESSQVGKNIVLGETSNFTNNTAWWLLGIAAALLLIGVLIGMKFSSMRIKKRLHGFSL